MQTANVCANCSGHARSRRRAFTEQAWAVLTVWGEVGRNAVDQPLCDHCYNELREVLIDRAEEIEAALTQPVPAQTQKVAAKKVMRGAKKTTKMAS